MDCQEKNQNHNFQFAYLSHLYVGVIFCTACGEVRKLELPEPSK